MKTKTIINAMAMIAVVILMAGASAFSQTCGTPQNGNNPCPGPCPPLFTAAGAQVIGTYQCYKAIIPNPNYVAGVKPPLPKKISVCNCSLITSGGANGSACTNQNNQGPCNGFCATLYRSQADAAAGINGITGSCNTLTTGQSSYCQCQYMW